MNEHHDDERFDQWVREAARGYNRPPDIVPRDTMWSAIAARGGRRGSRRLAVPLWSLAAAAVLLLAAGIGLGRLTMQRGPAIAARGNPVTTPRVAPESAASSVPQTSVAARGAGESTAAPSQVVARRDERPGAEAPAERRSTLYDVATVQHLTAAEALLSTFRAARDTSMDDAMRGWARDLLSTTRLLLDSPAASDAQRRRLLEDLEVVLVQMVRLPAHDARFDREMIERSIARQQVLTRIRTSIPAGASSGT